MDLSLSLVDQVHRTLGRHRDDDPRRGWISGLESREAEQHPTAGAFGSESSLESADLKSSPMSVWNGIRMANTIIT
ncbi:MAG: hypothetical protein JW999_00860 [Methanotrichaceae archaeon]|nr:hypothetical protein [Methanotrichaceae archaeon]